MIRGRGGRFSPRQRKQIIQDTLKRVPQGGAVGPAGPAGPPGAPGGVTSYNGRVGVVVPVAGDAVIDINAHVALADPHVQYQKESEKGAASGYASLDAGTKVPSAQIPAEYITDVELAAELGPYTDDVTFNDHS